MKKRNRTVVTIEQLMPLHFTKQTMILWNDGPEQSKPIASETKSQTIDTEYQKPVFMGAREPQEHSMHPRTPLRSGTNPACNR
jgi:hypothetical protein